jgi:hypothetical protein
MFEMNTRFFRAPLQILALLLAFAPRAGAQRVVVEPADIIVIHARAYTENPKQPWAQAVAIRGAKIVAVGDDATI